MTIRSNLLLFSTCLAGLAIFLAGCSDLIPYTPPTYTGQALKDINEKSIGDQYRIGPGDILMVEGWKDENLRKRLVVLPDGKISFPLIGDITAEGLTPQELAARIGQEIQAYVREANVTVIVEDIRSMEYSILGESVGQGVYPLSRRTTLLEAIARAQGFGRFTDRSNVVLIRSVGGKEMRYRFDFNDYVKNPESQSKNVEVLPGDVILFP